MHLLAKPSRFLAVALAAVTLSTTTLLSPPAQAWNPFGWLVNSEGSVLNRVVHGVVGAAVAVTGVITVMLGVALVPVLGPFAVMMMGAGIAVGLVGTSIVGGAVANDRAGQWWDNPGATGSNVARNGRAANGGSGAGASSSVAIGQPR